MSFGIRAKLFGGFGSVLALILVVGYIGWHNTTDFAASFRSLYDDRLVPVQRLSDAEQGLYELRLGGLQYHIADAQERAAIKADTAKWRQQIEDNLKAYAAADLVPEEQQGLAAWAQQYPAYLQTREQIIALEDQGQGDEAAALRNGPAAQQFGAARDTLEKLLAVQTRVGAEMNESVRATADTSTRLLLGAIVLSLLLGGGMAFFISRSIAVRTQRLATQMETLQRVDITNLGNAVAGLARGDPSVEIAMGTQPVPDASRDELGRLAHSFNGILAQTHQTIEAFRVSQATVRELLAETRRLNASAKDGRLSERGNASQFQGAFCELVEGINATLDAVIAPIRAAAAVLERVAQQDLAVRVQGQYQGDHATIQRALNQAVEHLDQALMRVAGAGAQVASAASQISGGSQSLSQGASEQASALQEVASSLQEITAMAQANAANATAAQTLAVATQSSAEAGVASMQRLSAAIEQIQAAAAATAKIVQTIDALAFQTNLLALN